MISRDTLLLVQQLLDQTTLAVGAADFEQQAPIVATAKREVRDALADFVDVSIG